jgi:uncharacterized membrane protein YfcA
MLDLLLELADWFLSWRLYVGFVITGLLCWLIVSLNPDSTINIILSIAVGLYGVFLTIRWELRAGRS